MITVNEWMRQSPVIPVSQHVPTLQAVAFQVWEQYLASQWTFDETMASLNSLNVANGKDLL